MQVADYILGNEDRHGANFGFFMDNRNGKLKGLYPLMDHDHAFSEEKDIPSQTTEFDETLQEAAIKAVRYTDVKFDKVLKMDRPEELGEKDWSMILERCRELKQGQKLHQYCEQCEQTMEE